MTNPILWNPDLQHIEQSNMFAFTQYVNTKFNLEIGNYSELQTWSVRRQEQFWSALWDFCGVTCKNKGELVLQNAHDLEKVKWFPHAHINYAENLLTRKDNATAIIFNGEGKVELEWTYAELYQKVASLAATFKSLGLKKGDRVAAILPNLPHAIAAMLATTSMGAIWSSCSPDFGVRGIVDRFGQIKPKILLAVDGYYYKGKRHNCVDKTNSICSEIPSIEHIIQVPYVDNGLKPNKNVSVLDWDKAICNNESTIDFEQLPFNYPVYILFSSGTTGVPKCIVHRTGGVLLKHLCEHKLHTNVKQGARLFYFTTLGWMMWNWLVSGLAANATLILFDGSPFYPDEKCLWNLIDKHDINIFGTSAKYIDAVKKSGLKPMQSHNLDSLDTILSTGSPLVPESFDFVYEDVKQNVCLSSISGGTDIVGCFAGGNPMLPVYRGELQSIFLGMDVDVFDDNGRSVDRSSEESFGELVCKNAFPSMPAYFWNDDNGEKYHKAYFDRFPSVWCHGDWVGINSHGGMVIQGRSDATLNPGGVRIGTAEIYRQVEQIDEIVESIVIGQNWQGDVRVVLFVVLREGHQLDDVVRQKVRTLILSNTTPRHVPAKILQVDDIPRTKSGKIVELAVRNVVHGRVNKNIEALDNPEALEAFRDLAELEV